VRGPLTVAEVPGTHETLVLEPNVRELAKALSHHLRLAQADARSSAEQARPELKGAPA
jgi:hypothetical protein